MQTLFFQGLLTHFDQRIAVNYVTWMTNFTLFMAQVYDPASRVT